MSNDIKGTGNSYSAEFWEYDPRSGRRWNLDPIPKSTVSPYVTFGNNPISYVDPLGNDWYKNQAGNVEHKKFHGDHHKDYEYLGNASTLEYRGYEYSKS